MRKRLAAWMEWARPAGVGAAFAVAYFLHADDAAARFHVLAPLVVIALAGTIAFESLALGEVASEKIGYAPSRAYQVQSGLNSLALTATAVLVYALNWGRHAEAAVVTALLVFLALSASNHAWTAIRQGNRRAANLMRPALTAALLAAVLPQMVMALRA